MLIILLIFALIRTLRGAPLASPLDDSNGFLALDLRDAPSHFGERAISDIILSCFATIFACTWSAVHPNIPAPKDSWWTRFKRQIVTMVYSLLAPEAITAWALRQYLAARTIVKTYNNLAGRYKGLCAGYVPRWTLAHGFFLQMGGFMLAKAGEPIQTLSWESGPDEEVDIVWNIKNRFIDPPITTKEDIQDRSKGDAISKTLIILQTTWFISQCIARWFNGLPVTELEVVTLGFAMLNGFTYGLWWHKPQNVGQPVFLEIKRKPEEHKNGNRAKPSIAGNSHSTPTPAPENSVTHTPKILEKTASSEESYLRHKLRKDIQRYAFLNPWKLVYLIALRLIQGLLRPLSKLADYTRLTVNSGDLRVPMFYSDDADNFRVYGPTVIIGVLFGSVHLITGWFLDFATVQEMWLWRVSAIIITVGPVFLGLWQYFDDRKYDSERDRYYLQIFHACLIGMLPLYIISRIILLTIALTSLRVQPPAALQTIGWTTFLPHI